MSHRTLPTVFTLTRRERSGQDCIWCGHALSAGAVPAGIAVGYWGSHNRSTQVYACPGHPNGLTEETQ
ncbi:hypothetical protein [Streptomyces sp. NPDC012510]|uniref:hypothetical protein n=1 Tax=Streptomyces sp. NPDC012510 TaxID=3364838 RepID=UPI0036E912E4